jgi:Ion channel
MREHDSQHADSSPLSARMVLRVVVRAPESYGFVLVLLLVSFILAPLVQGLDGLAVRVLVQGTTMLFALYTSRVRRRTMRLAGVLCALALLLALAAVLSAGRMAPEGTLEVLIALLLAVAVPAILRRILTTQTVDGEAIFGALDVYIMFGLFFAAVYTAIGTFSATPFFGTQATVTSGSYQFFSFVTLTTVGYGNLVPATQVGQSLAVLEALLGQIYLVTLVARLVSGFQPGSRRRALRQPVAKRAAREAMGNGDAESETGTSPNAAEPSPTRE